MNFISTFDELSKLYEEAAAEEVAKKGEKVEEACKEELTEAADEEVFEDEVPVEEVPVEEPVVEDEPRQVICECDKCGALVIKDEADIVVDEESDLVNVEDECKFCEEAKGFKIVGVVAPYEVAEEVPAESEVEEVVDEALELTEAVDPVLDGIQKELVNAGYDASFFDISKGKTDGYELTFDEEKYNEKDLVADLKAIIDKLNFVGSVNFLGDRIEIIHLAAKGA
jgi:hypothetical protein